MTCHLLYLRWSDEGRINSASSNQRKPGRCGCKGWFPRNGGQYYRIVCCYPDHFISRNVGGHWFPVNTYVYLQKIYYSFLNQIFNFRNIWPVFFIFTAMHIFSNYRGVSSVCLHTFNSTRFLETALFFLQYEIILPPSLANSMEPVFFLKNRLTGKYASCSKILCFFNSLVAWHFDAVRVTLSFMPLAMQLL